MAWKSAFDDPDFVRQMIAENFVVEDVEELIEAIQADSVESVELLLGAGGDAFVNDARIGWSSTTPIEMASIYGNMAMLRLLLAHGARVTVGALSGAISNNSVEQMTLLLDSGGDRCIDDYFDEGITTWTPLIAAAAEGNVEMVKLLIARGADINAHRDEQAGETALAEAVTNGHYDVAEILVNAGADPRIKGGMWLTALHHAERRIRMPELYELLKSAVARLEK